MIYFVRTLLIVCLICFAFACSKDSVAPKQTMTFTYQPLLGIKNAWVIISNSSGTVLDWKPLVEKTPVTLSFAANTDSIYATVIQQMDPVIAGGTDYWIYTFTNIDKKDYQAVTSSSAITPTPTGYATLQDPSPSDYSMFRLWTPCSYTNNSDYTQYQLNVCDNSPLYVWMQSGTDVPRYYYNSALKVGDSFVTDQSFYNKLPEMKVKTIALSSSQIGGFSLVTGVRNDKNYPELNFFYPSNSAHFQTIYYPDQVGTMIDKYNILVNYYEQNGQNLYFQSAQDVTDPSTMTIVDLPANLNYSTTITPDNLKFTGSGNAHYFAVHFASSNSPQQGNCDWIIHGSFKQSVDIHLPEFPDDLKKEIDVTVINDIKLNTISFVENSDTNGYKNFYETYMLARPSEDRHYRSKVYMAYLDGSIGDK